MSNTEWSLWKRFESQVPIIIGIVEILVGLACVVTSATIPNPSAPKWATDVLTNLGVGLMAAGAVTATLEPISRRRQQNDIEEIKSTHFEGMLRGVMPEPIFDEIQAQIIRQPFLRENVRSTYELRWADEDRQNIVKYATSYYEVTNISKTLETYEVRVLLEKAMDTRYQDFTKITELSIQQDGKDDLSFSETEILQRQRSDEQSVEIRLPLLISPNGKTRVRVCSQSVVSDKVQILVMNTPTVNFDVTVTHPDDMAIRGFPLHPSSASFVVDVNTPTLKRWRIDGGLLPYQGIELSWSPKQYEPDK